MQLEKRYPGDLRNRQVGARLIEDGKLPYFYKWRPGDAIRYYDPNNADSFKVSIITATPFFHRLIIPFCDKPFNTFAKYWLVLQYVCFGIIMFTALSLCRTTFAKLAVFNTCLLFLLTEAWILNAENGQIYVLIATFFSVSGWLLLKYKNAVALAVAGLCIVMLVLMRPIAIVLLIPFLLHIKQYRRLLTFTLLPAILYGLFYLVSPFERALWKNYAAGMKEQLKLHQNAGPAMQKNYKIDTLTQLEGFDVARASQIMASEYEPNKSENGNIFYLYFIVTHTYMSLYLLNILLVVTLITCAILYYKGSGPDGSNIARAVMFGMVLYMLTEIFSPVHRQQYNTVQWLPIILLLFACIRSYNNTVCFLIALGILLNISNTHLLPMRHTIGELIFCCAFMLAFYKQGIIERPGVRHKI
ncbi:MAG TPA: glycosyltransferase 87 family protein [Chitinophagaceae bacterium]|nr:glycosyltransferase 87 family protein [Chitinophagaceae bacterium]